MAHSDTHTHTHTRLHTSASSFCVSVEGTFHSAIVLPRLCDWECIAGKCTPVTRHLLALLFAPSAVAADLIGPSLTGRSMHCLHQSLRWWWWLCAPSVLLQPLSASVLSWFASGGLHQGAHCTLPSRAPSPPPTPTTTTTCAQPLFALPIEMVPL